MGKKKRKWHKKPKLVEFGMVSIENAKLPKIDKTPDANWKQFLKELKVSEKSKMIKKKKIKIRNRPKQKSVDKVPKEELTPPKDIQKQQQQQQQMDPPETSPEVTKQIAIDCEMVGVGINGKEHMLARCSIVNTKCEVIYDKFVKPREQVVDFRYKLSGVTAKDMENGENFLIVQKEVSDIISNRILVGHTIRCDLKVLFIDHPRHDTRDISMYKPLKEKTLCHRPGLKLMCKMILGKTIQEGHHDSVEDARATMQLFLLVKKKWERRVEQERNRRKNT